MKFILLAILLSLPGSGILAQAISERESRGSRHAGTADESPSPGGAEKKSGAEQAPQGPTIIDSQNMDYDEKTRISIFTGDNYGVLVKDPSFTVNCDKLTACMRKASGAASGTPGSQPGATPTPAAKGKRSAADATPSRTSGLERAIAEGSAERPVVILQDKPATNGSAAVHNVGIAQKADYNADTGDVVLTGWPRVSQGVNTQIATAAYTVMTMNRDGHTMKTRGPSRTVIQQQDQPKTTGTDAASPAQSPSPSPQ